MDIIKRDCCNRPCISGREYEIVEGCFVLTYRTACAVVRPEMDGAKKLKVLRKEVYKNFLHQIGVGDN
jgi:hypothetical protein